MKVKSNPTILVSVILTIALIASAIAIVYWDKQIWNFAEYVRDQRQVLRNEQAAVKFLSNVDKEIKQIKDYSEFFDEFYVGKDSILSFIEELESVARASGTKMQIQNVVPGETAAESYTYVNITLQSSGAWENVNKFVKLIEMMPYYVSIKVLNLSRGEETWTASMTITTVTK